MKKIIYIAASLFLTITMQAQDRTMPKAGPSPKININKPESCYIKKRHKIFFV